MSDVFVAGSLRQAPREWWKIYENIAKLVKELGYTVHVPHIDTLAEVNQKAEDIQDPDLDLASRAEVFKANFEAIKKSRLFIAEITKTSIGTGVEIGYAMQLKKKIICLARKGVDITSMVLGPAHLGLIEFIRYENEEDALAKLRDSIPKSLKN
jgi:nucleoside 2-deoxyribosyltransferase